ncbi:hypothetical protein K458DRAFT_384644 [Lentithecium fluviatile CBS 122367]|uniref:Uncharacterized protein n=1 Tax=Lentithecium fluviatile CBS 122367 TaxID=1168545 RepID=A0A6G1JDE0_9PLEO|nr:hypothetical protein K458DRAFT_384644 [Lentithecium fluviatile CBS 122367]
MSEDALITTRRKLETSLSQQHRQILEARARAVATIFNLCIRICQSYMPKTFMKPPRPIPAFVKRLAAIMAPPLRPDFSMRPNDKEREPQGHVNGDMKLKASLPDLSMRPNDNECESPGLYNTLLKLPNELLDIVAKHLAGDCDLLMYASVISSSKGVVKRPGSQHSLQWALLDHFNEIHEMTVSGLLRLLIYFTSRKEPPELVTEIKAHGEKVETLTIYCTRCEVTSCQHLTMPPSRTVHCHWLQRLPYPSESEYELVMKDIYPNNNHDQTRALIRDINDGDDRAISKLLLFLLPNLKTLIIR